MSSWRPRDPRRTPWEQPGQVSSRRRAFALLAAATIFALAIGKLKLVLSGFLSAPFPFASFGFFAFLLTAIVGLGKAGRGLWQTPTDEGRDGSVKLPLRFEANLLIGLRSRVGAALSGLAFAVLLATGVIQGELATILASFSFAAGWIMATSAVVTVGSDGIVVNRYLWREFIPFSDLSNVTFEGDKTFVLKHKSGRNLRIAVVGRKRPREPIYIRIREGIERYGQTDAAPEIVELLRKGPRTALEWLKELKQLHVGSAGYRERPLEPEHLLRVAEDPMAPDDARVAAAHVLRNAGDADAVERFRIAKDLTVSPTLRAAFDALEEESAIARDEALLDVAQSAEKKAHLRFGR